MLDTFNGQIVSLSMHAFGCRVVQRILEHCGGTPRYDAVMAEVTTVSAARGRGRQACPPFDITASARAAAARPIR
jgi:hypothetical protein